MTEVIINNESYGGAIDGVKESDWILGTTITVDELPDAPRRFRDVGREVNQNDIAPNICTIVGAFGAVSDVTGYMPTTEDIMEVRRRGLEHPTHPFDPSIGRYVHLAVDEVRRYCNEKGMNLSSLTFKIGSEEHEVALNKGYTVETGHQANRYYNNDRDSDGVITHGGVRHPSTYGHANDQFRDRDDTKRMMRDSYKGRPTNIYENQAQDVMLEAGRQFRRGFIFFPKYIMDTSNLPPHVLRDEVEDYDSKNIIIAWETEVSQAMKNGHTPIYKDYTSTFAITRMLIELQEIRSK